MRDKRQVEDDLAQETTTQETSNLFRKLICFVLIGASVLAIILGAMEAYKDSGNPRKAFTHFFSAVLIGGGALGASRKVFLKKN